MKSAAGLMREFHLVNLESYPENVLHRDVHGEQQKFHNAIAWLRLANVSVICFRQ